MHLPEVIYKGKDEITGYYVYGPLTINEQGYFINDVEAGLVKVLPETITVDN